MTVRAKRPDLPGGRSRSIRIRLSEREFEELSKPAQAQGVSVARYVLTLVFTGEQPAERAEMLEELRTARQLLARLGANVNQATKVAHVTGDTGALDRMAAQVEAALRQHDRAVGGLR